MNRKSYLRASARWLAAGVGMTAAAYGAYVGMSWYRYGDAAPPSPEEQDPLLDRFMPSYDVAERHHVRIAAPAAVMLAAAQEMELLHSPCVRVIIKGRELILGAKPDNQRRPRGLLAEVQSLGWGTIAEVPGRETVVGGVTKPWEANPTFRALPPDEFLGSVSTTTSRSSGRFARTRLARLNRSSVPRSVNHSFHLMASGLGSSASRTTS
jgi:hypothetical protein